MNREANDHPYVSYQDLMRLLMRRSNIWLFIAVWGAVNLIIFVALGFALEIIFFGLTIGFWQLALIWDPAYRLFRAVLRLREAPRHLPRPSNWHLVYSILPMLTALSIIAFGLFILTRAGFCSQNIPCLVLRYFLMLSRQ